MIRAISWISGLGLALLAAPASTAAPYNVLGYYLGQPMDQVLALDKTRATRPCGERKCLKFEAVYLGLVASIAVELDGKEGVRRIGFSMDTDRQPDHLKCSQMGGKVVAGLAKLYGRFNESDPGAMYKWHDDKQRLRINIVCFSETSGTISGFYEKAGPTAH